MTDTETQPDETPEGGALGETLPERSAPTNTAPVDTDAVDGSDPGSAAPVQDGASWGGRTEAAGMDPGTEVEPAEIAAAEDSGRGAVSTDPDRDSGPSGGGDEPDGPPPLRGARLLEREGDLAADYLETLLDIADLDGDIDMDIEGERATVDVVGDNLGRLIGSGGETLDALQELTRLAVQRETGVRSRLMLDIGGFRAGRRTQLRKVAVETATDVRRTGVDKALQPMTPFERKVVHDAIGEEEGVRSESEGEEPHRFVVVRPS